MEATDRELGKVFNTLSASLDPLTKAEINLLLEGSRHAYNRGNGALASRLIGIVTDSDIYAQVKAGKRSFLLKEFKPGSSRKKIQLSAWVDQFNTAIDDYTNSDSSAPPKRINNFVSSNIWSKKLDTMMIDKGIRASTDAKQSKVTDTMKKSKKTKKTKKAKLRAEPYNTDRPKKTAELYKSNPALDKPQPSQPSQSSQPSQPIQQQGGQLIHQPVDQFKMVPSADQDAVELSKHVMAAKVAKFKGENALAMSDSLIRKMFGNMDGGVLHKMSEFFTQTLAAERYTGPFTNVLLNLATGVTPNSRTDVASMVHDLDYFLSDGDQAKIKKADKDYLEKHLEQNPLNWGSEAPILVSAGSIVTMKSIFDNIPGLSRISGNMLNLDKQPHLNPVTRKYFEDIRTYLLLNKASWADSKWRDKTLFDHMAEHSKRPGIIIGDDNRISVDMSLPKQLMGPDNSRALMPPDGQQSTQASLAQPAMPASNALMGTATLQPSASLTTPPSSVLPAGPSDALVLQEVVPLGAPETRVSDPRILMQQLMEFLGPRRDEISEMRQLLKISMDRNMMIMQHYDERRLALANSAEKQMVLMCQKQMSNAAVQLEQKEAQLQQLVLYQSQLQQNMQGASMQLMSNIQNALVQQQREFQVVAQQQFVGGLQTLISNQEASYNKLGQYMEDRLVQSSQATHQLAQTQKQLVDTQNRMAAGTVFALQNVDQSLVNLAEHNNVVQQQQNQLIQANARELNDQQRQFMTELNARQSDALEKIASVVAVNKGRDNSGLEAALQQNFAMVQERISKQEYENSLLKNQIDHLKSKPDPSPEHNRRLIELIDKQRRDEKHGAEVQTRIAQSLEKVSETLKATTESLKGQQVRIDALSTNGLFGVSDHKGVQKTATGKYVHLDSDSDDMDDAESDDEKKIRRSRYARRPENDEAKTHAAMKDMFEYRVLRTDEKTENGQSFDDVIDQYATDEYTNKENQLYHRWRDKNDYDRFTSFGSSGDKASKRFSDDSKVRLPRRNRSVPAGIDVQIPYNFRGRVHMSIKDSEELLESKRVTPIQAFEQIPVIEPATRPKFRNVNTPDAKAPRFKATTDTSIRDAYESEKDTHIDPAQIFHISQIYRN